MLKLRNLMDLICVKGKNCCVRLVIVLIFIDMMFINNYVELNLVGKLVFVFMSLYLEKNLILVLFILE